MAFKNFVTNQVVWSTGESQGKPPVYAYVSNPAVTNQFGEFYMSNVIVFNKKDVKLTNTNTQYCMRISLNHAMNIYSDYDESGCYWGEFVHNTNAYDPSYFTVY